MRSLSLRDKIAQLVIIKSFGDLPPRRSSAYRNFLHLVRDLKVGGVIVVNRVVNGSVRSAEPYELAAFINRMQKLATIPLLVGGDFERGASMRVTGTIKYPHLMAYGAANDLQLTRGLGAATAAEARALGINWVFAPVADVNNNPENPIINIRSFGEDPQMVSDHVKAFIAGAQGDLSHRVLVTVKHFPGHGDTNVDTHMGMAKLAADRARMDQVELIPFKAAIGAGVDAVMTAHMAVPAIEKDDVPATVSRAVLTNLLRNELKFNGLVVTDAMDMQGLTKDFSDTEAAVRAIEAGADVLLMPPKPEDAINGLLAAVQKGRISSKRIDESVARILSAKVRLNLQKSKLVDVDDISDVLSNPEAAEIAQRTADRAITLVKNANGAVPVKNPDNACVYILTESRQGQQGRRMLEEIRARNKQMQTFLLDPDVPQPEIDDVLARTMDCQTNVVAAFVSVAAYQGNVGLRGNYPALVSGLMARTAPLVLISLGSPYLLRSFPEAGAYITTYSPVIPSEVAAVKAVFGEIPFAGRSPVKITSD
jgi:beta-N-acetylhexosaminidase